MGVAVSILTDATNLIHSPPHLATQDILSIRDVVNRKKCNPSD